MPLTIDFYTFIYYGKQTDEMRDNFESSPQPAHDEAPELFPITAEVIRDHLLYIDMLWRNHANANAAQEYAARDKFGLLLREAYRELDDIEEIIDALDLPDDLLDDLENELHISCAQLHKVIKYYP